MIFLAVIGLVVGIVLTVMGQKGLRRYHRIKDTPTSRVTEASGNGLVEVKGRVVTSERGPIVAPFTGRHGVWVAIDVQEYRRSGKSGSWVSVHNERYAHPFWIDDGSGQRARLEPEGGELVVEVPEVSSSGTFRDAPPHLQQFLQSRNLVSTNFLGMNKSMRFHEYVLAEGDPIYALGSSRRVPGPPVHDGYRMQPSSTLVLFHGATEREELIVSTKTEDELAGGLRRPFLFGVGIMIASAVGIVAIAVGWLFQLW